VPEAVLVGARNVRVRRLVVELDAVGLRAADDALLLGDRKAFPGSRVVDPLLQEGKVPPAPGLPSGTRTTPGASINVGFSLPSMKPVRSRSCWYGQLDVSSCTETRPASSEIAIRAVSKITSYALPDSHSTESCCVAGLVKPSTPTRSTLKPSSPGSASSGTTDRHSSGRNPATRFTPPIVVRGSRSEETAVTTSRRALSPTTSNSR
jgi:hypothetical protein